MTKGGKPAVVAPNRLQRQFNVKHPDRAWVTDITYLRTAEGVRGITEAAASPADLGMRCASSWPLESFCQASPVPHAPL